MSITLVFARGGVPCTSHQATVVPVACAVGAGTHTRTLSPVGSASQAHRHRPRSGRFLAPTRHPI